MERAGWVRRLKLPPLGKYRGEIRRYLLLLLLPVLVLALLYLNVNQVVKQQAEEYAELTVDHFYVQSSSMLHEMQLVSGAILRDSSVNRILNAQEANALNSLDICDIIRDGLDESPYVQHAYLICGRSGNIYSDQGLFGSSTLPVLLGKIGSSPSELDAAGSDADFHILNRDALAPYCIFHIQNEDGTPAGSLIVTLQMSEFLRIFHSLDVELCALFNQDVYISSYISNISIEGFDWRSEANVSALVGKAVTCKYIEGDGYTYMVAVPRENYSRPLYVIIKWALIYAAAALVLGYLYLYQIAKRRYQRISAMAAQLPNSYEGDQSLEHIYDNIRKSLEEYKIQKEHFQLGERERTLHSLLAASGSQDATSARFEGAGVEPGRGPYYVAAFFPQREPSQSPAVTVRLYSCPSCFALLSVNWRNESIFLSPYAAFPEPM